jgi:hypothetical protein
VIRAFLAVAAVLALSACGESGPELVEAARGSGPGAPTATATAGTEMSGLDGLEAPPPFRLQYEQQELALHPYSFCFGNGCADGFPQNPPSVGSPSNVHVFVPVEGMELTATFTEAGQRCGRSQTVEPVKEGNWYVLRPTGAADSYEVDLFTTGAGSMSARFLWSTPTDGPLATPEASMGVIADHDGKPDSYGVELSLSNLAATPRSAEARITVTAANGDTVTFDAHRATGGCRAEGSVFFDGPDEDGRAASQLGGFPFRYDVTLKLDGSTYRSTAIYPRDEIDGNEPSVRLTFDPPLPALG